MQKAKRLSLKQAVKQFCRECNGENPKGGHHYDCLDHNCVLYPFKEGKGNYELETEQYVSKEHIEWLKLNGKGVQKSKEISEEAKQKFSERMKKAWETRKKNNLTKDNQMNTSIKKKELAKTNREIRTLSNICKDCGRYRSIPTHFCNECWKEMYKTFNKGENNE